jgi:hypothetical protein
VPSALEVIEFQAKVPALVCSVQVAAAFAEIGALTEMKTLEIATVTEAKIAIGFRSETFLFMG